VIEDAVSKIMSTLHTMPPLTIFFPGLGADSTLARFHPLPEGESLWIEWPDPIPGDWDGFVEAMTRQIPSNRELRFVGISFGGLAAMATARRLRPAGGVFLIGSLEDRRELQPLFRLGLTLVPWIPARLFDLRLLPNAVVRHVFGIREPEHLAIFRAMAARLPAKSVKALCRLLATWTPQPEVKVRRIHGRADGIIRPPRGDVETVQGGHLISMTNAQAVNEWLAARLPIG